MFHLLAYTGTPGVNAANFDLTAAVDQEITARNGHYTFTEKYKSLAEFYLETSALRASYFIPTWNQYTRQNIWPPNRVIVTPTNPQLDWRLLRNLVFPQNEEIQLQVSNNLGAATEQATVFIWIAPADGSWNQTFPKAAKLRETDPTEELECRINFTTNTIVANSWSGLTALTFEQSLRGGVYAVMGVQLQGTGIQAFRLVFPRAFNYMGRRMRPGTLCSQAIGDVPMDFTPWQQFVWGEWGRFSTFELPQMEFWSNVGGAIAVEGRLWLTYLSEDASNVNVDPKAFH